MMDYEETIIAVQWYYRTHLCDGWELIPHDRRVELLSQIGEALILSKEAD